MERLRDMLLPICGFLLLLVAAVLIIHALLLHELIRIFIYLIVALLCAILFPRWYRPLDKDFVDLIYYTVAMAVVALLFATKSAERERLMLSETLQRLEETRLEAEAHIAAFDAVKSNLEAYQPWINGRIEDAYLRKEEAQRQTCSCAQLGRLSTSCGKGLGAPLGHEPGEIDMTAIYQRGASQACNDLTQELRQLAAVRQPAARTLEGTLALARQLYIYGTQQVGSITLPAATLIDWIDHIGRNSEKPRAEFLAKKESVRLDQDETRAAIAATAARSKTGIGLLAGEFSEFYWPYFLISLLGLKIARVDYGRKVQRPNPTKDGGVFPS